MKKIVLLFLLVSIAGFASAQAVTAPKDVQHKFDSLFPTAAAVKWEKKGVDYHATFTVDSKSMGALFSKNGVYMQKEMGIAVAILPQAAKTYIEQNYPGKGASSAWKVFKPNGNISYKVMVGAKELMFDSGGNFIAPPKPKPKK